MSLQVAVLVEESLPWHAKVLASLSDRASLTLDPLATADVVLDLRRPPEGVPGAGFGPGQEVWAFEVGTGGRSGLGQPGRRELADGAPTCDVRLVRLRPNGVQVLREGRLPVQGDGPDDVARALLARLVDWPRWALAARDLPPRSTEAARVPLPPTPPPVPRTLALRRRLLRRTTEVVLREHWNLGLCRGATLEGLVSGAPLPPPQWASEVPDAYLADPFALPGGERLMAERYSLVGDGAPATLVELEWDGGEAAPVVTAQGPSSSGHVSYPSVFAHNGALWCTPESASDSEIVLWRREDDRWVRVRTLLAVPGVDPDLVLHDGRWWLFFGLEGDRKDEELHLAWAGALDGEFRLHPLNPVVRDVCAARGGGRPFVVAGVLHRPAQDCSTTYGGSLALAEIVSLSPLDYQQRVIRRLDPFPPYGAGLHTLNAVVGGVVVDGKRSELAPGAVADKLVRRVWGRAGG